MEKIPDCKITYHAHSICWRVMGIIPSEKHPLLYKIYAIIFNFSLCFLYPLHLNIGLIVSDNLYEAIQNLSVTSTVWGICVKSLSFWLNYKDIPKLYSIINRQQRRIALVKEDAMYYKNSTLKTVHFILKTYTIWFTATLVACVVSMLINGFMGDWQMFAPAYFPFDIYSSRPKFFLALTYQYVGCILLTMQGYIGDIFVSMHLAMLSGQVRTLCMRVNRLGKDEKLTKAENNKELTKCIRDHKDLLEYRKMAEQYTSTYMLFQIVITSINMCATVVLLVFYPADPFTILFQFFYLTSMVAEILPACYFGSIVETEFGNLTHALFSSNWLDQDAFFKKNLRIFVENTVMPVYMMAGIFRMNLELFIVVCKNSYSIFALIMNMK